MKLINYSLGYNDIFDCSIHGTIKITRSEFDDVVKFLYKNEDRLYLSKKILIEDLSRRIVTKKGFLINIRATATQLIAKKYNLKNYKNANYQIEVTQ